MNDLHERADDARVMRLWREAGLPEYFLGNGETNAGLVRLEAAIRADERAKVRDHLTCDEAMERAKEALYGPRHGATFNDGVRAAIRAALGDEA